MIAQLRKIIINKTLSCNDSELLDLIAGMLTSKRKEDEMETTQRLMRRHQQFEGFGEKHTAPEWSKLLGLHRTSVWRYLYEKGLSIEEIASLRNINYPKMK